MNSTRVSRAYPRRPRAHARVRARHSWQLQCEMPCVRPRAAPRRLLGVECFKPLSGNTEHVYKLSPRPGGLDLGIIRPLSLFLSFRLFSPMGNLCRDARYARIMRVPRPLYSPCGLFRVMNLRDRPRCLPSPTRGLSSRCFLCSSPGPIDFPSDNEPTISIRPVILSSRSAPVPLNSGAAFQSKRERHGIFVPVDRRRGITILLDRSFV